MATPFLKSHSKTSRNFYGFHSLGEPGIPISFTGAFRDNIRRFLEECTVGEEDYKLGGGMQIRRTFLVYESKGTVLSLYTIEEQVQQSDRVGFCDYCRGAGWSHHFVAKRKYHFIILTNDDPIDEGVFDLQTHLLHGLIHCNGFGHLISINGIEGGSKFVCGREIMDLWDRLCTALCVRQITLEDLSKKQNMELHLLHGVANGQSWFAKWGYRFCHGSFGVKKHTYEAAMDLLGSLKLDQVNLIFDIMQMVNYYRDMSGINFVTIRDLLRYMLTVKPTAPYTRYSSKLAAASALKTIPFRKEKPTKYRKFSDLAAKMDSRWPVRRLEHVAEVIVKALKEKRAAKKAGSSGMTRQEARDAARLHIGDTGLIDHVLKAMSNVIVGNCIVCHAVNQSSKVLEYSIQDHKGGDSYHLKVEEPIRTCCLGPGRSIFSDMAYLYRNVLLCESVAVSAQMVLHSKHFVKEFPFRDEDGELLKFVCLLALSSSDLEDDISYKFTAMEYVDVPLYATVGDLKTAVENAFRDSYCMLEKMRVMDILELEEVEDKEVLFGVVQSGIELHVKGSGSDMESSLRFEGGIEKWSVKCKCGGGAIDDDGERMVACDICETWQHTYCCGIEEAEAVPRLFVCETCCSSLVTMQGPGGLTYGYEAESACA